MFNLSRSVRTTFSFIVSSCDVLYITLHIPLLSHAWDKPKFPIRFEGGLLCCGLSRDCVYFGQTFKRLGIHERIPGMDNIWLLFAAPYSSPLPFLECLLR